ncbi:hypothetical protein MHLNE_16800 [Moorella humiferrea]|uniref:hypothetical protein n=1 Tax=Neomoorella humiferrea TaxID=676965 RepID=UPI0030D06E71
MALSFWRGFIAGGIMGAIIGVAWKGSRETFKLPQESSTFIVPEEPAPLRSRGVVRRRTQI